MGNRASWHTLVQILQNGGREETGGLNTVDFGDDVQRVLGKKKRMQLAKMEPYEKLSSAMRSMLTKKEYEEDIRLDEQEDRSNAGLLPAVVFSFSKAKCEEIAEYLSTIDLLAAAEKKKVAALVGQIVKRLNPLDASLPQLLRLKDMLMRGIGIHHGGLLPILKELVELLFAQGVTKVLFATETFAMGVNMPARCVVFNGFSKHDGKNFRELLPGEYIQMAGRAGRRGLDKVGTVLITSWAELPSETTLKRLLTGIPTKLTSQFRLTYNMIVNLLRTNDLSVEGMIKRSFSEFHTQRAIASQDIVKKTKQMEAAIKVLENDLSSNADAFVFPVDAIGGFVERLIACCDLHQSNVKFITDNNVYDIGTALCPGRVVFLMLKEFFSPAFGIVQSKPKEPRTTTATATTATTTSVSASSSPAITTVEVLILVPETMVKANAVSKNVKSDGNVSYMMCDVAITDIIMVDSEKVQMDKSSDSISKSLSLLLAKATDPKRFECLDLMKHFRIKDTTFAETHFSLQRQSKSLLEDCYFNSIDFYQLFPKVYKLQKLRKKHADIKSMLSNESLALFPDFQQKLNVLKILNYVEADETLTMKGRIACEMTTSNELIAAEIIFHNILEPLNPPEVAAILSCLVFQGKKGSNDTKLTTRMEVAREQIEEIFEALNTLQSDEGIFSDPDNRSPINFDLSAAVYQWSRGTSFKDVKLMTTVQEGDIVRTVTRLDQLCTDFRNAARICGDPSLYRKMEACSQCIKRDIMFAASLYLV